MMTQDIDFKPNPAIWEKLNETEIEIHKNVFCSEYNACLSKMIDKKAKGWSCIFCKVPLEVKTAQKPKQNKTPQQPKGLKIPSMFAIVH